MIFENKALAMMALGSVLMAGACGTTDGDPTDTPTPTPEATPQALYFEESFISVTCDSSGWGIDATVDGWTDGAEFGIYDYTVYCDSYDSNANDGNVTYADCFREWHDMTSVEAYTDGGYYEVLSADLTTVAFPASGPLETIFLCDNKDKLTFVMCSEDAFYATGELCVWFGNEASTWEANGGR